MSGGDSSGGIVEVEEKGVAFGRGSEILTLDFDVVPEELSLKLGEVSFYGKTRYCSRSHHFELRY